MNDILNETQKIIDDEATKIAEEQVEVFVAGVAGIARIPMKYAQAYLGGIDSTDVVIPHEVIDLIAIIHGHEPRTAEECSQLVEWRERAGEVS